MKVRDEHSKKCIVVYGCGHGHSDTFWTDFTSDGKGTEKGSTHMGNTDMRDIITIGLLIQKSPKEEIFQTRVTKAGHYMPYTPFACLAIMNIPQATDLGDRRHGDFEYKNSQVQ